MTKTTNFLDLGFIRLNRRKKETLALQLYDALREAILQGQLASGFRLPSSRALASDLRISRTTVINAFDQLTAEGYLSSAVGKGTFVREQLPEEHQLVQFRPSPLSQRSSHSRRGTTVDTGSANDKEIANEIQLCDASHRIKNSQFQFGDAYQDALLPFRPGVPALDEFPLELWSKLSRKCWKNVKPADLSYGPPGGHPPLRKQIAEYVRAFRGVKCDVDQVFVVAGTQQAVDLTSRLLIKPGDKLLFENPGYERARVTFEMAGAKIVPVDVDAYGFDVDQAIRQAADARIAYVTPSHQFPMGVTLSIERRMKLIEWARETGGLIFEDDYDSEFRYSQRPIPSLQGLDEGCRTIYVGSFSKVVYPSLSMGYMIVPKPLIKLISNALSIWSRPVSTIGQWVLTDFLAEGHFARHVRRMRQVHQQRRQTLVDSIDEHLADHLSIVGCDAGLHCAARLLKRKNDQKISRELTAIGVVSRPLSSYSIAPSKVQPGLVLGFASASPGRIRNAIKKMKSVLA